MVAIGPRSVDENQLLATAVDRVRDSLGRKVTKDHECHSAVVGTVLQNPCSSIEQPRPKLSAQSVPTADARLAGQHDELRVERSNSSVALWLRHNARSVVTSAASDSQIPSL
jgi:hypothetical protein